MTEPTPAERPPIEKKRALKTDLIARLAAGEPVIQAAQATGIGWRRAYRWRAEDPEFRGAWDRARAQFKTRAATTSYLVPASPPLAPPEPLAVPPSPLRVAAPRRVYLVTVPGHEFTDFDKDEARAGDKVVTLILPDSGGAPEVITHTVQADRSWARDEPADLEAYEVVKSRVPAGADTSRESLD